MKKHTTVEVERIRDSIASGYPRAMFGDVDDYHTIMIMRQLERGSITEEEFREELEVHFAEMEASYDEALAEAEAEEEE